MQTYKVSDLHSQPHLRNLSCVYKITCTATGKFYIGSTSNTLKRWRNHVTKARKGLHHSPHFQRTWSSYGEDCFVFEILEMIYVGTPLLNREQAWLDEHKPWDAAIGLNTAIWAVAPRRGVKATDETKAKLRRAHTGKKASPEARTRMSLSQRGRKHTAETKAKIRAGHVGKMVSIATRQKLRLINTGKTTVKKGTKSKFRGVDFQYNRVRPWRARLGGRTIGRYATEQEAALAHDAADMQTNGTSALLNFAHPGYRHHVFSASNCQ